MFERTRKRVDGFTDWVLDSARTGTKILFSGTGGGGYGSSSAFNWWGHAMLPGTTFDYASRAGNVWENLTVATALWWMTKVASEPRQVMLRRTDGGRDEEPIFEHPAIDLLMTPNPFYDRTTMTAGVWTSLLVGGNAYIYKIRGQYGQVVGLLNIPHVQMEPRWDKNGTKFISHYEYRVDGKPQPPIRAEDIIQIRIGWDPLNIRKGYTPLTAAIREVCADNDSSGYHATILRNVGVPGIIISPKQETQSFTPTQATSLKEKFMHAFTGEHRGEPLASSLPIDVQFASFSPEELALATLRTWPMERICSALHIDPMVMGLPSERKTYSNFREAKEAAYENTLIPILSIIDEQMTLGLENEVIGWPDGDRLGRDYTNVRALQPDMNRLYQRVTAAVGGPWMTPNDARREAGQDEIPGMDQLYPPTAMKPPAGGGSEGNSGDQP